VERELVPFTVTLSNTSIQPPKGIRVGQPVPPISTTSPPCTDLFVWTEVTFKDSHPESFLKTNNIRITSSSSLTFEVCCTGIKTKVFVAIGQQQTVLEGSKKLREVSVFAELQDGYLSNFFCPISKEEAASVVTALSINAHRIEKKFRNRNTSTKICIIFVSTK